MFGKMHISNSACSPNADIHMVIFALTNYMIKQTAPIKCETGRNEMNSDAQPA